MAKPKHGSFNHFGEVTNAVTRRIPAPEPEPIIDPAMRARVGQLLKNLARNMAPPPDPRFKHRSPPNTPANDQKAIATGFAHLQGPIVVSEALRASLGRGEGQ